MTDFPVNTTDFYGFQKINFTFEDRLATVILPKEKGWGSGKWACKMVYFGAFPDLEIDLLNNGFHVAHMQNVNRWGTDADHPVRARFAKYMAENFGVEERFVPVGMSCGGLTAANFATRYPHLVSVLYLDAPVMNLLSCPMGFGVGTYAIDNGNNGWKEIEAAYGFTPSTLLTYREHPIDRIQTLIDNKIPIALVYGDSDATVPYEENGKILEEAYRKTDIPFFCVGKPGCGHHPHGLEDRADLLKFIRQYC